jgi:glycerophosphoryl diester phosphodiesterase
MDRFGLRVALAIPLGVLLLATVPALALDLQGHRGARGLAPENTLPAFAAALSLGVTTLELDTGITRDGVVVVSHEPRPHPSTARGPDGQWLAQPGPMISALTYVELLKYDVGRLNPANPYGKPFTHQVPVDGTRIPRLAEVFALVAKAGNDAVRFNIETKVYPTLPQATLPPAEFTRAIIGAIRAGGMSRRASIQSFDWATLKIVQAEAQDIPTVYLTAQQPWLNNVDQGGTWTAGLRYEQHGSVPKMVKAAGGKTWSPFFGDLDAAKLSEAHALGIEVVTWTVNSPADIARMIDLGVDGIISDRPDLVRGEMQKRGLALPAPTPVSP